jgi:hypothetical protein
LSSVIARFIIATPARHASVAWAKIVNLIAPSQGEARRELESIAGIASSLISEEAWKDAPAVMRGKGSRVRFYCLYEDEAISGEKANEATLATVPTEDGDWKMSLPCPADDLKWIKAALEKKSTHITVRNLSESVTDDEEEQNEDASAKALTINRDAFFRL